MISILNSINCSRARAFVRCASEARGGQAQEGDIARRDSISRCYWPLQGHKEEDMRFGTLWRILPCKCEGSPGFHARAGAQISTDSRISPACREQKKIGCTRQANLRIRQEPNWRSFLRTRKYQWSSRLALRGLEESNEGFRAPRPNMRHQRMGHKQPMLLLSRAWHQSTKERSRATTHYWDPIEGPAVFSHSKWCSC